MSATERLTQVSKHLNVKDSKSPTSSSYYKHWLPAQTRWNDNDPYGHVNNSVYAFYFDSIINEFLIDHCNLDITSPTKPRCLVIHSNATYTKPISYPSPVYVACSIEKLGRSSITWNVALFKAVKRNKSGLITHEFELAENEPCAYGQVVHVYVDPTTNKSITIPDSARKELEILLVH